MNSNTARRPAVNVYACGGCGINLSSELLEYRNNTLSTDIYSEFNVRYVDTSRQNFIGKDIDIDKDAYLFMNSASDGFGQIRGDCLSLVSSTYKEVFKKFPPAEINIVLFGMSGASGSVIGPTLLSEMVASGRTAIGVMVGAVDSLKYATNTQNTFSTLQALSKKIKKPLIVNYHENAPKWVETDVNHQITFNVGLIAMLFSGAADRIDSADLASFLDYTRVSEQPASLTALQIVANNDDFLPNTVPFAGLSILKNAEQTPRLRDLDFCKVGYLEDLPAREHAVHYVLDKPTIADNYRRVADAVSKLTEASKQRMMEFEFGNDADESGFVV